MTRTRGIDEVEDDGHGPYLRALLCRRKAESRAGGAHQARRIARQISRNTMAPMVAVMRLPQKSGMTSSRSFSNSQPAISPMMIQARMPMGCPLSCAYAALGGMRLLGDELEIFNSSSLMSTPISPNSGVDR